MKVSTVVIGTKNGPVVINESDFDKQKHKLFVAKKTGPTPEELDEKAVALELAAAATDATTAMKTKATKARKAADKIKPKAE